MATPSRPLARVLLRKVTVWYLVFAVGITGVQLYFEYRGIRQNIIKSLNSLAHTFAPGVAAALWDYQEDLLKSLAQGVGEHELVTAVSISDVRGRINLAYQDEKAQKPSPQSHCEANALSRF